MSVSALFRDRLAVTPGCLQGGLGHRSGRASMLYDSLRVLHGAFDFGAAFLDEPLDTGVTFLGGLAIH